MKTLIYFIRHAESDLSVKEDAVRPLTSLGLQKSKEIVKKFIGIEIYGFYSSPYKRAVQTIEPLAESRGKKIITVNNFRERHIGEWVSDFESFSKKQWEDFSYKTEDGESMQEVQARNIEGLNGLWPEINGKTIAIGTHGTALSTIINYYNNEYGYDDFVELVPKTPCIILFEFIGNKYTYMEEIKL
jgi:2,3-bisphosphoglycerate-dependent phosphoglycerate mutase